MTLESNLIENIRTFIKSSNLVYDTKDYTSATILYFKTLFSILDLIILRKTGKTPKDHEERFRILEMEFYELYKILDDLFSIYRESYRISIAAEKCKKVKNNVERLIKKYKLE